MLVGTALEYLGGEKQLHFHKHGRWPHARMHTFVLHSTTAWDYTAADKQATYT